MTKKPKKKRRAHPSSSVRIPKSSPIKENVAAPAVARVYGFDALRVLATFIIIIYHFTTHYDQTYGHLGNILGTPRLNIGVPTFLILSGFLNVMIMERTTSVMDWCVGKFVRLYPVYWVSCLITFSAVTYFMLPGREVTPKVALINLSMIQMLLDTPHIDGVYWTLQVVLFFYILLGLIAAARLKQFLMPIFMGLTALNIGGLNFNMFEGLSPETIRITHSVLVLKYACFFMVGMVIYKMRTRFRIWHLAGAVLFFVDIYTSPRWGKFNALYALPVIVFLVARFKVPGIDNRVFKFFATISYALYLIHQNVGFIVIRLVYNYANGYVAIAVAAAVVVGLASALTFFVERPTATFLKGRYTRWRLI